MHEEICAAQACLESPGCEGLVGVPGTDTLEGLCKYCQALKDLYGKIAQIELHVDAWGSDYTVWIDDLYFRNPTTGATLTDCN